MRKAHLDKLLSFVWAQAVQCVRSRALIATFSKHDPAFALQAKLRLEDILQFLSTSGHATIPNVTSQLPPLALVSVSFVAPCIAALRL